MEQYEMETRIGYLALWRMVMIMDDDNKFVTNVASIGMMHMAYFRGMGHQNTSYSLTENISAHI